jgi:hypothetical protein
MDPLSRRDFVKFAGLGVGGVAVTGPRTAWPDERAMARAAAATDSFALLRREQQKRRGELPPATDAHRLPLPWYQAKARALKDEARRRGVDGGIFLTRRWNIIYATGMFHSTTERPFACFLPMDDDEGLIWLNPYLDEELVAEWWKTDSHSYFDYHHSSGAFPNQGTVTQASTVSLYRWWGETLAQLGYGDKTIGIDSGGLAEIGIVPGQEEANRLNMFGDFETPRKHRPSGGSFGLMAEAMPQAQFVDIHDIMIRQRVVKDDMENRLTQRAMDYFSELHAFVRNYIIERGIGTIDWEIENAARLWGMHRIMQDIPQEGKLHDAVGIDVSVGCRTGLKTAYPHRGTRFSLREECALADTAVSSTAPSCLHRGLIGRRRCGTCTRLRTSSRRSSHSPGARAPTWPKQCTIIRSPMTAGTSSTTARATGRGGPRGGDGRAPASLPSAR